MRAADGVSAFPAPVGIGASWNRDLALKVAEAMGGEFRRKGGESMEIYLSVLERSGG